MNISEKLEYERLVRNALKPLAGESLEEAARRVVQSQGAVLVAEVLLGPGEPWERMKKAAEAARPHLVETK